MGVILFVKLVRDLELMKIWSSYARLEDVDAIIKSTRKDYDEYIKSAV